MAYNNYFPQSYQPAYTTSAPSTPSIIWVQGEAAARAYPIAPGTKLMLMDSENNVFYVKTSDSSGMPQPLKIFEYKEVSAVEPASTPTYITKEEFEERISKLEEKMSKKEKKNEQFAI